MIEFSRIKRPLTFIALLVALIVLGFIFRYNLQAPAAPSRPGPSGSAPAGDYAPTAEETTKSLLGHSQINFPEISRQAAISFSQLPEEIRNLIDDESSAREISRISYADGRTGFKVGFSAGQSLNDANRSLLNRTDVWKLLSARKGYAAAMIERQGPTFQIRVLQSAFDSSSSNALIQTVNSK